MLPESTGGITGLLKGLNFNSILGGANKTLGFIKQAIPVYNQVRPMWGNVKTFINMYSEVKDNKETEPNIKDTRPIQKPKSLMLKQANLSQKREQNINETLTFFQ